MILLLNFPFFSIEDLSSTFKIKGVFKKRNTKGSWRQTWWKQDIRCLKIDPSVVSAIIFQEQTVSHHKKQNNIQTQLTSFVILQCKQDTAHKLRIHNPSSVISCLYVFWKPLVGSHEKSIKTLIYVGALWNYEGFFIKSPTCKNVPLIHSLIFHSSLTLQGPRFVSWYLKTEEQPS